MLRNRMVQFLLLYVTALAGLLSLKYGLGLSDYIIPPFQEIYRTVLDVTPRYLEHVLNTLSIAILGHAVSLVLAFAIGILAAGKSTVAALVKTAAYNVQSYPIVAVAPIIFILLGDGLLSRLIISVLICYFPLLLTVMGVLSEPVEDIEHFYRTTRHISWGLQVRIRMFENIGKLTTVVVGSATMAMVGTIVSEFIASNAGIGYSIRIALYQSDMAKIIAALLWIGVATSSYLTLVEWIGKLVQGRLEVRR
ncbi:MAG: ABC transporter permease subunit [Thermodesulfobacteriota bacterium]